MSDRSSAIERVEASDLMFVWPEGEGWPQDIGALAILDGAALVDADGRFRIEAMQQHVERRLHLVPRLRQLMVWPPTGLGWPLWVDAPAFDIRDHVGVFPIAAPGEEAALLLACEELRRRPLEASRPRWGMWFLPGLPGGRVGLFIRLHHAIADGVAGVATLGALVDLEPDPPEEPVPAWTPAAHPSRSTLLADNVRRRSAATARALSALLQPLETMRRVRQGWPAMREVFAEGRAPETSVNRRIGSDRRLAIIRTTLELTKRVAHAHDATVNDVLLTAVAGGYRALLRHRGEDVDGVMLRTMVPVSLHHEERGTARGNVDAGMVVPLPVGEPDEATRLEQIRVESAERKERTRPPAGGLFRSIVVQRAFQRFVARQRLVNAYVANVPGPPVTVSFAGAPVLELFPIVPITGNLSMGVGALSYAGQFNITVVADRDLCPDLEVFVCAVERSLSVLERSVAARASAVRTADASSISASPPGSAPARPGPAA